jgi:RNA polymerase sigma factor (TIGR02999 family)
MPQPRTDITLLLEEWQAGDERAHEELLAAVYDELRKIARRYLFKEPADHSFRSIDLVHEAYLRLIDQTRVHWQNRNHFYGIAATLMRRVLADYARKKLAIKRGAQHHAITLNHAVANTKEADLEYIFDLDEALARLEADHPRRARVVELKLFVELTIDEIADVLDIAPATVKRDWNAAKSFLADQLRV